MFFTNRLSLFKSLLVNPNFILDIHLERSLTKFSKEITGSVLDFGCGSKPWERLFTETNSYIGVDLINWGSDLLEDTSRKVDVYFDGQTLPFSDGEFDAVVAFEVFEHLPHPSKSLNEINRVLKKGGLILISSPFIYGEHGMPHDYFRYTVSGMKQLLDKAGFVTLKIEKSSSFLPALMQTYVLFIEDFSRRFPSPLGRILRISTRVLTGVLYLPIFWFSRSNPNSSHYLNLVTLGKKIS